MANWKTHGLRGSALEDLINQKNTGPRGWR